jgi:hypothetical protein
MLPPIDQFYSALYRVMGLTLVVSISACSALSPTQSESPPTESAPPVQSAPPPKPAAISAPTSASTPPVPVSPSVAQAKRSLASPAETTPLPGAEKAKIKVGDKLWYRGGGGGSQTNTILREVIAIQSGQVQYKQSDVDSGGRISTRSRSRRQSLQHLELDTPAKSSGLMKYTDFPLTVGKSWTYRYQLKSKSGLPVTYDVTAKVDGEETISTPAGSFETLKITHVGKWTGQAVQGGSLKVSAGTLHSTVWFAMSVGNWAKFESEVLNTKGGAEVKIWQELVRLERPANPQN